jgi:transcriptional antiterminator RfaH
VYCKPRQERVANRNLERQGFETYLPVTQQRRRRLGRSIMVIEPMFPRYLFIRLDSRHDNWGPIRSTLGVTALVRFGQFPAPVPDELIGNLRQRDDEEGIQQLLEYAYRPGEPLRIAEGVMAGFEGIYLARSAKDRVLVLLEILGQQARVELARDTIEPVH